MEEQLVQSKKVYVKPLASAPAISYLGLDEIAKLSRHKIDATHVVLFDEEADEYNFTLVTKVAHDEHDVGESKSFKGICYIAGLNGDEIVDVAEDLPSFVTTFYVGE